MFRVPSIQALENVLQAAVRIDDAAAGLILLTSGEGPMEVAARSDAGAELVRHAATIRPGDGSATGQAASERRRVVIRDVESDPRLGHHRDVARRAGVRAVVAAPLADRDYRILGVLTTFYAEPHHPTPDSLAALDLCCRIAARLIEVVRLHAAMVRTDREMGIPERALSPSAAQAADAARVLLPSISRGNSSEGLLLAAERHLVIVADELASNLRKRSM